MFDITPITGETTRRLQLVNPHETESQHVRAIGFDGGGNQGGHFTVKGASIAGKPLPLHDISIPPTAALELEIVYAPKNLQTTQADFGGEVTGAPVRFEPVNPGNFENKKPDEADVSQAARIYKSLIPSTFRATEFLLSKDVAMDEANIIEPEALHRGLLVLTYDEPKEGVLQLELVGGAVTGPNGELTSVGSGSSGPVNSTCSAVGQTACFTGKFSIELPGLMQVPVEVDLSGPLPLAIDGGAVTVDMASFPVAHILVQGNGPGDPLEGQPIAALTIAISGSEGVIAEGLFDGTTLTLDNVGFRVRIYFSAVDMAGLSSIAAPVDFQINSLTLDTLEPLSAGEITLGVSTTLGQNPTGNPLADPLLSGAQVIVKMTGTLELP